MKLWITMPYEMYPSKGKAIQSKFLSSVYKFCIIYDQLNLKTTCQTWQDVGIIT